MTTVYTQARFVFMTLDPVHVGTGGYRLGRVDNSIAREPGTRLPKIPGTSLSGAARAYAAMRYEKPHCAGQKGHCGKPTCPICYTFGSIRGTEGGNAGTISIGDARILFFPVYSMVGPVWVTSPAVLSDFGIGDITVTVDRAKWNDELTKQNRLNLGWLMLEKEDGDFNLDNLPSEIPSQVKDRLVLISDKLFSQVVNSNLEVRTSVSIDPKTGAAEDGALFTYEAIPRATFLWNVIVEDDYRRDSVTGNSLFPKTTKKAKVKKITTDDNKEKTTFVDNEGEDLGCSWDRPLDVVTTGLEMIEHLGVGGMGTRGFGRMKMMSLTDSNTQEVHDA